MSGRHQTAEARRRISAGQLGPRHHAWRGDDAGYWATHHWLRRHFGHEKTECEECGGEEELEFAFKGEPGGWSRNRADYRVLCNSCHQKADRT